MTEKDFFIEQSEVSRIKSEIVSKYFIGWASVIINTQKKYNSFSSNKIAYIDLFCGPGRYDDGNASTPLKVLEYAINNEDISERLVTIFNDKEKSNCEILNKEISKLKGIEKLKHAPQIINTVVDSGFVSIFEKSNLVPTFFFVDPFGYKGLSSGLIYSVLKNWGCDCIFFLNYNRINMAITNPALQHHITALFGTERLDILKGKLHDLTPEKREMIVIEEVCNCFKELGVEYTLPFRFKDSEGTRTSHHLIFLSKDFKGYDVMKNIMAKESQTETDGVPSFDYSPALFMGQQSLMFNLSRPLEDLKGLLLEKYAGTKIKMIDIYKSHSVDRSYVKSNYKQVLIELDDGKIISSITEKGGKRKKGTFGDNVFAIFP